MRSGQEKEAMHEAVIDPQVLAVTGERWIQSAITAVDRGGGEHAVAVIGHLDDAGDLRRVTVVREGAQFSVRFSDTPEPSPSGT